MAEARIGIIGGTNLYQMEGLQNVQELAVETPFGDPSEVITVGDLDGISTAFLPRHGRGHRIMPTEIPARANIYALKSLGVETIVSISAVGSLKEEIRPLDVLIPDQIIDRTRARVSTFFGGGIVAHVGFAQPFCPDTSKILYDTAKKMGATVHQGGTYVVMEGPHFSTKAESNLYRSWGADIIGMTALPEAKLAREAEICYATLAFITDYDCWHETCEPVTIDMVINNLNLNAHMARQIIRNVVKELAAKPACACASALENNIITQPDLIPASQRDKLDLLIRKYIR